MSDFSVQTTPLSKSNQTAASVGPVIIVASFISVMNTMPVQTIPPYQTVSSKGLSGYNLLVADKDTDTLPVILPANYRAEKIVDTSHASKETYVPVFTSAPNLDTWS